MFLQYYTKSVIMFYINENFFCLSRNDSNRLKTDLFANKNSISRIEKWYSGNVYVNGHAFYNIHMIGLLLLRHFPVSIYIWYVIHVCDRTDSWRTLNTYMTMCMILKTNRREMLKTILPQMMWQMMQINMWTRRKPWYIPRWMNIKRKTSEELLTEFINWYSEYVYVIRTVLWFLRHLEPILLYS